MGKATPRLTPEALEEASAKAEAKQVQVDAEIAAEEATEEKATVNQESKKITSTKIDITSTPTEEELSWMFNEGLVEIGLLLPVEGKTIFKKLCRETRVKMIVPYDIKETANKNIKKEVIIGGLKFTIPKNTYVNLPDSVAKMIMESQDTQGINSVENSHGESLNINSADKAKKWFGVE